LQWKVDAVVLARLHAQQQSSTAMWMQSEHTVHVYRALQKDVSYACTIGKNKHAHNALLQ
jgi:hypothetical protein